MVSRIALYPDPLVAQILAAATYPDQIPEAIAPRNGDMIRLAPGKAEISGADALLKQL